MSNGCAVNNVKPVFLFPIAPSDQIAPQDGNAVVLLFQSTYKFLKEEAFESCSFPVGLFVDFLLFMWWNCGQYSFGNPTGRRIEAIDHFFLEEQRKKKLLGKSKSIVGVLLPRICFCLEFEVRLYFVHLK